MRGPLKRPKLDMIKQGFLIKDYKNHHISDALKTILAENVFLLSRFIRHPQKKKLHKKVDGLRLSGKK